MGEIFVITESKTLVPLSQQNYDSEDLLQTLLASYPNLLAGDQIAPDAPRRWLLVKREAAVPAEARGNGRWSLDHLFLDQDGVPTLVEVKRSTDTRIRREVIGQMLDYAANGVKYWPIESLRTHFEQTSEEAGIDVDEALAQLIGERDPEQFWTTVKTNLQAGRIRMLFVADVIPEELRRVIEFLNEQMDPAEVLGVEIKQFAGGSLKTLVPRVVGQTVEAEDRKRSGSRTQTRQWDEPSYFAEMEARHGKALADTARKILEWAIPRTSRIFWGKGKQNASFIPVLRHDEQDYQLFAVYTGNPGGTPVVEIHFQWWLGKPPFSDRAKRREMMRRLNEIPGVAIPEAALQRRPSLPLERLQTDDALNRFFSAFDWFGAEIRAIPPHG